MKCWGCAAVPSPGDRFSSACPRCIKEKCVPVSVFCGKECFRKHWARHKVWHKAKCGLVDAVSDSDSYEVLVQKGTMKILASQCGEGEELLLRAIALDERRGMAFRILADAYRATDQPGKEADAMLSAMACFEKGTKEDVEKNRPVWAKCASRAFAALQNPSCAKKKRPVWMQTKAALVGMTTELVELLPQDSGIWAIHGGAPAAADPVPPTLANSMPLDLSMLLEKLNKIHGKLC